MALVGRKGKIREILKIENWMIIRFSFDEMNKEKLSKLDVYSFPHQPGQFYKTFLVVICTVQL